MALDKLMNGERFFLTDAGMETTMVFEKGFELPCFSATVLLDTDAGRAALKEYFETFIGIARQSGRGYIIDAPTWRAGLAWSGPMGMTDAQMLDSNRRAVAFVSALRDEHHTVETPIIVNGQVGPAGDAYASDVVLTMEDAEAIHAPQVAVLKESNVDLITALTLTNAPEAAGIARAAKASGCPIIIGFTVETDGRLPTGQALGDAIEEVDRASDNAPLYFMINCAHPDHFEDALTSGAPWLKRIGGIRANASRMSHAELDNATELDSGDPAELGKLSLSLVERLPNIKAMGGCCGTDHRHIAHIAGTA